MSPSQHLRARVALFGGTFDPIHDGHLAIARAARDRFGLARVLFVPNANPPHKDAAGLAPFADRARMVELACAGEPGFEASRIEEGSDVSYSILTIERLMREDVGPLAFLIGADAFAEFRTWHRWEDVMGLVEFIVVLRPGATYEAPSGSRVFELPLELPVSSSEVRKRARQGDPNLPVPALVAAYIHDHDLYRSQEPLAKLRK